MKSIPIILGLVLLSSSAAGQELESWDEVDLKASAGSVDLLFLLLARLDSKLPNPQLAATGFTAEFHLPEQFSIAGGYLFADLPQLPVSVHLPLMALTKSFAWNGFRVDDRNRFEGLLGLPKGSVRYRNRFLVNRPLGKSRYLAFLCRR